MNKMIVCTSTSCMDYLDRPNNIAVLPINVHINDKEYIDGRTITVNELANQIITNPNLNVFTSAPHEGQLIEFFYELIEKGVDEILLIPLSSHLSQTYQNTRNIQSIFGDKLRIHLFDSKTIQHAEAVLAFEAAKMLKEGKDFNQISQRLHKIRDRMHMYITVDNLNAMIKTKRVFAPAGWVANLLDIKPIVFVQPDGKIVAHEKIRGFENSLKRLVEIIKTVSKNKKGTFYTASYSDNPYIPIFKKTLASFGYYNVPHFPLASATIANIGVYTIGMMFVEDCD